MDLKNASILITGAGSGIGQALALRLAEHTPRLTLVGRRQQPSTSWRTVSDSRAARPTW